MLLLSPAPLSLGVYFEINLTSVLQTLLPLLHPHTVIYKSATARTQPNQLSFHHLEFIYHLELIHYFYQKTTTKMNLDCYTQYIPLTAKARFWGDFVSSLKGNNSQMCTFNLNINIA